MFLYAGDNGMNNVFNDVLSVINDFSLSAEKRLLALADFVKTARFPPFKDEINNHIHTMYSFSPYTPSMAALKARQAGLQTAGSVDHDSLIAAEEMQHACDIVGLGCATGFELRVSFKHTPFATVKINNPDSEGIVYMTIQGVPVQARKLVSLFLAPINYARNNRNRAMIEKLNVILQQKQLPLLSYEKDVCSLSQLARGGSITERHIVYALAKLFIQQFGKGKSLVVALKTNFGLEFPQKIENLLLDVENPYYEYDLLGLLKSSFVPRFFIQPSVEECPPVEVVTAFAQAIGAIPAYAYLGDVADSPTGDKKAEKFEDSFLDNLVSDLKTFGFLAVTYMPPRNTGAQLAKIQSLCKKNGLMEISGVDINTPRQKFECPEIARDDCKHLVATTWALVAHERLSSFSSEYGLFSENNPLKNRSLEERIQKYADIGLLLAPRGTLTIENGIAMLK